ncbi:ImmA/IrrE family metallo-endopeptidase [Ureibacillus chungkukjangi]|uniref:ImmA/IrrE family metallo-endopeptidase n=1 Tax=Ureibacillus chungkukjangi TaxID=1202712 RepID=UPI0020415B59|nr:ImmA/IrrE family metallo-endopeptidase [Ureibacillus chungkukjangi]MCM3389349.1 ImmA/IrrE family metallo-endopeptidase [Ureibacillus chungkukjangi]
MINHSNVVNVITQNRLLLPSILNKVEETKEQGLSFRYKTIEAIKSYLIKETQVLLFPSMHKSYGGLVTYRNGRFFIHINTGQPKTYENFIWAHEYYHFKYEAQDIKNSQIRTFFDDAVLNEKERAANLFAAELLVDSRVLKALYQDITTIYPNDSLENNVIRLIPAFELPYKAIVVKLAQDGLISEQEAINIIDYNYRDNLPSDFDQSILKPTGAIKINNLGRLLNDQVIETNMLPNDLNSFRAVYQKYLSRLEGLREKEKE